MKSVFSFLLLALFALSFSACEDDDDTTITPGPTTFDLTIENVSTAGTIPTDRAMGVNPLSPPVIAIFTGDDDPMFTGGESASEGTERIAEDGSFDAMIAQLTSNSNVKSSAAAPSPGGPGNNGALFNGERVTVTFVAEPGDKMQFESMFVQSNDWFYAFPTGGLELFDGATALSGDLTGRVIIYDAGTEVDTAPGTGQFQKPVQDPDALDVGPDEDEPIQNARTRHSNFTIPANDALLRVTITPRS